MHPATDAASPLLDNPKGTGIGGRSIFSAFPGYGHTAGVLNPGTSRAVMVVSNPAEPFYFENENCWGLWLPMFRPTADPAIDSSGAWPYGDHFRGRRRLWEHRFQLHFKKELDGPLLLGLQFDQYVPFSGASKQMSNLVVAALKRVSGPDLYHSCGEDPKIVGADAEKPILSMPLWAFDQFIFTEAGEKPPSLNDPNFAKLGVLQTTNRKHFITKMKQLQLQPGPTYTFAFWGISQIVDCVKWDIAGVLPMRISFNKLCGQPPVDCTLYTLKSDKGTGGTNETRHFERRKNYLFRLTFWSSLTPLSKERVAAMFPLRKLTAVTAVDDASDAKRSVASKIKAKGFFGQVFECCTARPT